MTVQSPVGGDWAVLFTGSEEENNPATAPAPESDSLPERSVDCAATGSDEQPPSHDPTHLALQDDPLNPLSPHAFPHLVDAIISYLPHSARLALRATCHILRHAVDALLVRNLMLTPDGPLSPSGRVPISALRPALFPSIRALDLSTLTHPLSSRNDAALAHIPPLASLPGLRVVRTGAEKCLPRFEISSAIRMVDITYSNPGRRWAPWRIHARALPPNARRLVLHVRYRDSRDIMHAQLSPRFWAFPASLAEVVLHVRPHPHPDPGVTASAAHPDNGFEQWARLVGLARVLGSSQIGRVCLVGAESWSVEWVRDVGCRETSVKSAWRAVCVAEMVAAGWGVEEATESVERRFEFVTEDAYRADVGERQWRFETAGTLAELEEWEV